MIVHRLTKEEQKEILGGVASVNGNVVALVAIIDAKSDNSNQVCNINSVTGCVCVYNDDPKLVNSNTIMGCMCTCKKTTGLIATTDNATLPII
ncbi:MAG: hypothetical protein LBR36_06665 [Bacteroidales bacterium]|jgi:hypothetical protein|nr:hypothetical protein [Bacteroidales bacterium]